MPGTITFRPIEANLTHNTDILTKMNPYCSFILGSQKFNSQICKKGGKHPIWSDAISIPTANETVAILEIMDKDRLTKDDVIGGCSINLQDLEARGTSRNWYPLFYKNKPAGEILLETSFDGGFGLGQQNLSMGQGFTDLGMQQTQATTIQETGFVQQDQALLTEQRHGRIFTEQHQVVEPHTFIKPVEVIETVPVLKEIEVMEPRKVLKDVEYTEAVPVRKQIEVVEPQVVMKEVEVIEPRVVTKTIQVVENVPVKKQVEVVEMQHLTKEVETFEPQTFHKQVEVTEQVPVLKTVTVTEPVTVTKAVEFVEPVITTQTITKEIVPEVIVNQKVTTEVGPATLVGMTENVYFGQITEQERLWRQQNWINLGQEERLWREKHFNNWSSLSNEERLMRERQFKETRNDKMFL